MTLEKIIDEYSSDYCQTLELAYGDGMMSEGGTQGIDHMFAGFNLHQKNILDIGFGLGGIVFYLADKHEATVAGVEINPWMVKEATRRIPSHLKNTVSFYQYTDVLPFDDESFDIVFSKGVLCHLEDKQYLFNEINRVLKPEGKLIIDDWLSPVEGRWSDCIQEMCEIENLTLFPTTEEAYRSVLEKAKFHHIDIKDENELYALYNREIAACLSQEDVRQKFLKKFSEEQLDDSKKSYELIAEAFEKNELLLRHITASK